MRFGSLFGEPTVKYETSRFRNIVLLLEHYMKWHQNGPFVFVLRYLIFHHRFPKGLVNHIEDLKMNSIIYLYIYSVAQISGRQFFSQK